LALVKEKSREPALPFRRFLFRLNEEKGQEEQSEARDFGFLVSCEGKVGGANARFRACALKSGFADKSPEQRAKSQQIVGQSLLSCLQYPVPYLSRLQRIYPSQHLKLRGV
jgi:hypothetical protein